MNDRVLAVIEWLRQPSSLRGLIAIAGAFGIAVSPELLTEIVGLVLGLTGLINTVRKEK